jgi:hypothetical protein
MRSALKGTYLVWNAKSLWARIIMCRRHGKKKRSFCDDTKVFWTFENSSDDAVSHLLKIKKYPVSSIKVKMKKKNSLHLKNHIMLI